jgi:hypothetical protein
MKSRTQRLVESFGQVPTAPVLSTPDEIRDYVERMRAASKERLKEDRRAAAMSLLRARNRIIL